jgi:hypothetical protein
LHLGKQSKICTIKLKAHEQVQLHSFLKFTALRDRKLDFNCSAHWPSEPYAGLCKFSLQCNMGNVAK